MKSVLYSAVLPLFGRLALGDYDTYNSLCPGQDGNTVTLSGGDYTITCGGYYDWSVNGDRVDSGTTTSPEECVRLCSQSQDCDAMVFDSGACWEYSAKSQFLTPQIDPQGGTILLGPVVKQDPGSQTPVTSPKTPEDYQQVLDQCNQEKNQLQTDKDSCVTDSEKYKSHKDACITDRDQFKNEKDLCTTARDQFKKERDDAMNKQVTLQSQVTQLNNQLNACKANAPPICPGQGNAGNRIYRASYNWAIHCGEYAKQPGRNWGVENLGTVPGANLEACIDQCAKMSNCRTTYSQNGYCIHGSYGQGTERQQYAGCNAAWRV